MNKLNKLNEIFLNDYEKYLNHFRKKYIPKKYNQILLMDELENPDIDHYISISNRADGKTFNYIHYLLDYSLRTGVGFTLIARHYTVRFSYQKLIQEIIDTLQTNYDPKKFHFIRNDFYILIGYKDKEVGIITDLNQATDLKYLSNYLKHFPIMVYDEFLALEGDYLPDEWDRLKTIYSSINRKTEIPHIKIPKIIYLGNAVNFSSPILSNLNIFNILENHKINTMGLYGNIALEMMRNDKVNIKRNLRAFDEYDDDMTKGQFNINYHNIASKHFKKLIQTNKIRIIVKTRHEFLIIEYNRNTHDILLSITNYEENYNFNTEIKDNTDESIFLNASYYDDDHYKKYDKDLFKFNNQYSKDMILDNNLSLSLLKITKIIQVYEFEFLPKQDIKEVQYKENYLEQTKKALVEKFMT